MIREDITKLDRGAKYKIWFHYLLTHLGLKHNFHTKRIGEEGNNWGPADKVIGNLELRYIWKDLKYTEFENYTDDMLWEWYWRFEDEIQL